MMYKVAVNGKEYQVAMDATHTSLNGTDVDADIIEIKNGRFHIISNRRSFTAEVISRNEEEKSFVIRVNNHDYHVVVKDKYDMLIKELGMDVEESKKVNDIKAPMPGMVLKVLVENGQEIQKGDAILILEAMKMENILKASTDGVVKKVHVIKGDKVEKNQVLINMS